MKNYIAVFILLFQIVTHAQDKVAYKWFYTIDEESKKYVVTSLRLFDHAYNINMQYMFSCIARLAEKKIGIIPATLNCKKQLTNDFGQWVVKGTSYDTDFKASAEGGKELKISILNRDVGFNKMLSCLAGRTKFKPPSNDVDTIDKCLEEIAAQQTELNLYRMNFVPTTKALSPDIKEPKGLSQLSDEVSVYYKCLALFGRKKSRTVFPDDDELFNYCAKTLENFINEKNKVYAYVPTVVDFYKSNYSLRVLYALEQILLQHQSLPPLNLAVKMQIDSDVAFKLYQKQLKDQEALDSQIPYPLKFLRQYRIFE